MHHILEELFGYYRYDVLGPGFVLKSYQTLPFGWVRD